MKPSIEPNRTTQAADIKTKPASLLERLQWTRTATARVYAEYNGKFNAYLFGPQASYNPACSAAIEGARSAREAIDKAQKFLDAKQVRIVSVEVIN